MGVPFQVAGDGVLNRCDAGTVEELIVMDTHGFMRHQERTKRELLEELMMRPDDASQLDTRSMSFWKAEMWLLELCGL